MQAAALRQLSERLGASSGRRPFKRGKRREDQLRIDKFKTPLEHKPRPQRAPVREKDPGSRSSSAKAIASASSSPTVGNSRAIARICIADVFGFRSRAVTGSPPSPELSYERMFAERPDKPP